MPRKINFKQLERELSKGGSVYELPQLSKKFWNRVGRAVAQEIKTRTNQSRQLTEAKHGASQRRMKPLKPSTIAARRRRGVSGEGATPEKSSLSDTGQMMRDVTFKLVDKGIKLFFKSQRSNDIAYWHNYEDTSPSKRFFLWLSAKQIKQIKGRIIREFNRSFRKQ